MLVFGHTHKPWVHEYGGVLFVNCGSVGKPKDGDPRGAFAILRATDGAAWTSRSSASSTTPRPSRARWPRRGCRPSTPTSCWPPRELARLLAEFLGSALLAAVVIGSGIAAQELSQDTGLQLLENSVATRSGCSR